MNKYKKLAIALIISFCFMTVFYSIWPLYRDVDNYMMSVVTNGMFDADNYCIFMNPFLNWMIGIVSKLFPAGDGFLILENAFWMISFFTLFYGMLEEEGIKRIFSIAVAVLLSFVCGVWNANFTIQAAGFTFLGLFLLSEKSESDNYRNGKAFEVARILIGTLAVGMGLLMRIQAGMLFVPFLLLHGCSVYLQRKLSLSSKSDDRSSIESSKSDVRSSTVSSKSDDRSSTESSKSDVCSNTVSSKLLDKTIFLKYLKRYLPVLLVFLAVFATRHIYRSNEEYVTSVDYNVYRVKMEDYPVKEWSEIVQEYGEEFLNQELDITEADYENAKNWILYDTEHIDVQRLKNLAAVSSRFVNLRKEWMLIPSYMMNTVCEGGLEIWILLAVTFGLFVAALCKYIRNADSCCDQSSCFFKTAEFIQILESVLILLGGAIIILAFTIIGRAPARVWESVLLAQIFSYLILLQKRCTLVNYNSSEGANTRNTSDTYSETNRSAVKCSEDKHFSLYATGILCILLISLVSAIANYGIHTPQFGFSSRTGADDSAFASYEVNNQICIHDHWHELMEETFMKQGKLPTQAFLEHNIAAGDWTYGQVYYNNYLERLGISNPAKAMEEREDVLFIEHCVEDK